MLLFSLPLRDIDRVIFTLGMFHSNKNEERIKDSGFWIRRSQAAGMKGMVPGAPPSGLQNASTGKENGVTGIKEELEKIITADRQREAGPFQTNLGQG